MISLLKKLSKLFLWSDNHLGSVGKIFLPYENHYLQLSYLIYLILNNNNTLISAHTGAWHPHGFYTN